MDFDTWDEVCSFTLLFTIHLIQVVLLTLYLFINNIKLLVLSQYHTLNKTIFNLASCLWLILSIKMSVKAYKKYGTAAILMYKTPQNTKFTTLKIQYDCPVKL